MRMLELLGFAGSVRMSVGDGKKGEGSGVKGENGDNREGKIHPLGHRRWRTISIPERVWWKPGVMPERHPAADRLMASNPVLRKALETMERSVERSSNVDVDGMTLVEWFEERFAPNLFPLFGLAGIVAWCWYSFPASARLLLTWMIPRYWIVFSVVAGLASMLLGVASLILPPQPTDAIRRLMFLYGATTLAFPLTAILAASGYGYSAMAMDAAGTLMASGSLWFWRDLNAELASAAPRDRFTQIFLGWRKVFTALCALGLVFRALVFESVMKTYVTTYQRGLSLFLRSTSPTLVLLSDPSALAVLSVLLSILYVLYALVFCTFVTDVGRYPYARKISSPLTIMLAKKGIFIPFVHDQNIELSDSRGGLPSKAVQKIGKPDRPGQRENMPEMEYPFLFRQLDKLESEGKFSGMYRTMPPTSKKSNLIETWALFSEIPEDESITDSVEIVNPAKVSQKRIQAILDEAQDRLEESRSRRKGNGSRSQRQPKTNNIDSVDDDGDDDDDNTTQSGSSSPAFPDDDSIEWLYFDPDEHGDLKGPATS